MLCPSEMSISVDIWVMAEEYLPSLMRDSHLRFWLFMVGTEVFLLRSLISFASEVASWYMVATGSFLDAMVFKISSMRVGLFLFRPL